MIPYILYTGVILTACFVFYKLLVRNETFYKLNRFLLLGCLLISFALPFVPVSEQFSLRKRGMVESQSLSGLSAENADPIISSEQAKVTETKAAPDSLPSFGQVMTWFIWVYWFGVAAFGIIFLVQLITLLYRAYSLPSIRDGRFRIVEMTGDAAPCSFGNTIYINPEKYDWDTYNQILLHEKIHIREGHSFDILVAELVLIFQWFNPFAWLYRKEVESNLEFLTDDHLLRSKDIARESYQLSLLKVSAPHFPLSLTTNYNQSLLKKRLVMMNIKRSSLHSTWKYLFIIPLLVTFVCLFNEPTVYAQKSNAAKKNDNKSYNFSGLDTEGAWFATIKNDKISIQFKSDDDENSSHNATFPLKDFKDLPREVTGTLTVKRDAGTIEFTGKFEGNQGMGNYRFIADKDFSDFLKKEGIVIESDGEMMAYFVVDVQRAYVTMLKKNGFSSFSKHDLLPVAALKIDDEYIKSLRGAGFQAVSLNDLIPMKSLGIDAAYITEIKNAGYKNLTVSQVITFKAQGITGKMISDRREEKTRETGAGKDSNGVEEAMLEMMSQNIDPAYKKSLKDAGYPDLSISDLMAFKSLGITSEFIQLQKDKGFQNLAPSDLYMLKAQNVTMEYIRSFDKFGYSLTISDAVGFKALGVTPEYIAPFYNAGFKNIPFLTVAMMKSQDVTVATVQEYKTLGIAEASLEDIAGAKALGVTPAFVKAMKEKGHHFPNLRKYAALKGALE